MVLSSVYVSGYYWPYYYSREFVLSAYNIFWISTTLILIFNIINVNWHKFMNQDLFNAIKTIASYFTKFVSSNIRFKCYIEIISSMLHLFSRILFIV